jgi:hypothetical protein
MSFSQKASGSKAEILAALGTFAATQLTVDQNQGASQDIIDGHQQQVAVGVEAGKLVLEQYGDRVASVNVYGSANYDGSGNGGMSYDLLKQPTEPPTE